MEQKVKSNYKAGSKKELTLKSKPAFKVITLAHGAGGRLTNELITEVFLPHFAVGKEQPDAAVVKFNGEQLCLTTDSFVIKPLFFPGGDIGKLAVCGSINDLAVMGAKPTWLTLSFIIEEGFSTHNLSQIVKSIAQTAAKAGVVVVTGDTKVVEKKAGDGIYINTTAAGPLLPHVSLTAKRIKVGDVMLISGCVGSHGAAILNSRYFGNLNMIYSDCQPIHTFTVPFLTALQQEVKWMRDPTRGGLATLLNELALIGNFEIEIEESLIPIEENTQSIAEVLGIDPFYLASEGCFLAVVSQKASEKALALLKEVGLNKASIIGQIKSKGSAKVVLKTLTGSRRILRYLAADSQPRIC